jgi:hypothetical protein
MYSPVIVTLEKGGIDHTFVAHDEEDFIVKTILRFKGQLDSMATLEDCEKFLKSKGFIVNRHGAQPIL